MKQLMAIMAIIFTILMTLNSMAIAEIETDWEYGMRNPIPDESYIRFDFETGGIGLRSYSSIVDFVTIESKYPLYPDKWYTPEVGERGYHIYPRDFYYDNSTDPPSQVDFIYIVNGSHGAQPVYWWCNNVKCEYWPGCKGRIEFPNGASSVSFLSSNGTPLQMKAYGKTGKYLGYSGVAYSNTERIPPDPSSFTKVSFTTATPIIYAVEIVASGNNFFIIDDLVIGGLTLPEKRRDYRYAAERLKKLIGADFLEFGLGYNLIMREFYTAEQILNEELPYWNPEIKELLLGKGIYDQCAIVWAFNENEDIVNWADISDQAKHDFTEKIAYEDIQPGDVFFIDYPPADGQYDEVGIVIEPMIDTTGDMVDIIRIIPEAGVHYSTSEFINSLYDVVDGFVDYRSLSDNPKGGHSPYPKIPIKRWI